MTCSKPCPAQSRAISQLVYERVLTLIIHEPILCILSIEIIESRRKNGFNNQPYVQRSFGHRLRGLGAEEVQNDPSEDGHHLQEEDLQIVGIRMYTIRIWSKGESQ
jgi:hypothetical protein